MLYRYAGEPSSYAEGVTSKFPDAAAVSDYAQAAMTWAVDAGIIKGVSNTYLDPQGIATRAQVATVMQRYIEYCISVH
jgi:phage baseplate assembly protein gpV